MPGSPVAPPPGAAYVWNPDFGEALVLSDSSTGNALLIDPAYTAAASLDSVQPGGTVVQGRAFDLLLGSTRVTEGRVSGVSPNPATGCTGWPVVHFAFDARGGAAPGRWTLAVPAGRVEGIGFDSLPALSRPDSLSLTIAIARAASTLRDDTSGAFQGRPFVIRQANRFALAPTVDGVLAEVVRTVNLEASPLQEQLVLLLQGAWRAPDSSLRVLYHARVVGLEENIPSIELLGVLRSRARQALALLLRRESADGWRLEMLEQVGARRWMLRWKSALSDC